MRIVVSWIILSMSVVTAGCQANSVSPEARLEASPGPDPTPLSTPETVSPIPGDTTAMAPSTATGAERLIEMARADLAQRLVIPSTQINLTEITEVEWSDSSLGCPQPGMDYLQVITPGYRILLEANAQVYEYHSNRDIYVIYCENPNPIISPPKP